MKNYENCCYTNASKRKLSKNNWTELKVKRKNRNISYNVNDKCVSFCIYICCFNQYFVYELKKIKMSVLVL